MSARRGRAAAVALTTAAVLVTSSGAAAAHVRVDDGSSPAQGGYGVVRLVVPTESDTASTVGLTVTFPADVALSSARTLPVAGWSATVETEAGRVTRIEWRADDESPGIGPSEFGLFTFSAGPWPQGRDTVELPATQSYDDGSQVAWDEVALDADSEPEHPAPVVALAAPVTDHHGAHAVAAGPGGEGGAGGRPAGVAAPGGGTPAAQWTLVGLAVALSAAALTVSVTGRRPTAPAARDT